MAAKFDIKKAAVDHAEKVVFGIIVLIVIMSLASTKWSRYEGTPGEIVAKVKEGRTNLVSHDWPEEQKEQFVITPEKAPEAIVEKTLHAAIDIARYDFSNKFLRVLGADREPLREPTMVPPEDPIVSSGRVFIHLLEDPNAESTDEETLAATTEPTPEPEQDVADEFLKRNPGMGAGIPGMEGTDPYGGGEYIAPELYGEAGMSGMYGPGGDSDIGAAGPYGPGFEGDSGYVPYGEGMEGAMGMPVMKLNGQGFHYAAIRAVFPYREQIRKFADAIHRSYHEAAMLFQIIDFELQRQTRLPGDDPWSGPWEPVDIKVAEDVLQKCAGYDVDVVNGLVTDAVITMPLPMRITGRWKRDATHPRIANFELSDAEMKLEMELNKQLLKEFVEQKRAERELVVQRGGFADVVFDTRSVQSQLMGMESSYEMMGGYGMGGGGYGEAEYSNPYGEGYGAPYGQAGVRGPNAQGKDPGQKLWELVQEGIKSDSPDEKKQEEALREWIKKRVTASSDLLLFRYIDFSVEPGKTYRYRVRLVLSNPNFGRRQVEAGGLAHVVEGETRTTDWSEVTAPITIADSMTYFLTGVREPRSYRVVPSALLDAFQYDPTYGTFVNHAVDVVPGQKVGGQETAEVYKPAESKVESSAQYVFTSDDLLVDAIGDIEIDPNFHAGEKVDAATRLKLLPGNRLSLPNLVLVDQAGEGLALLDGKSRSDQHKKWISYMEAQKGQFEYLKKRAEMMANAAAGGEYGGLYGGEGEGLYGEYGYPGGEYGDEMGMMMMGGGRGRNAMRKVPRSKYGTFMRQGGMGGEGS